MFISNNGPHTAKVQSPFWFCVRIWVLFAQNTGTVNHFRKPCGNMPIRHKIHVSHFMLCSPKSTSSDVISDGMIIFLTFFNCTSIIRFRTNLLTNKLANFMEQSPSQEVRQKIPRIMWKLKVLFRIHTIIHLPLSWPRSIQTIPPTLLLEDQF
jgi:hypothetical protein